MINDFNKRYIDNFIKEYRSDVVFEVIDRLSTDLCLVDFKIGKDIRFSNHLICQKYVKDIHEYIDDFLLSYLKNMKPEDLDRIVTKYNRNEKIKRLNI